jgi:gamma-glutamyltranspeptidase
MRQLVPTGLAVTPALMAQVPAIRQPVRAKHSMMVAMEANAADVGVSVLQRGRLGPASAIHQRAEVIAVDAPRFHHQWQPEKLFLEPGISPDTVALLESRGDDVDYSPGVVLAQVTAIVSEGGWLQGGSDGRTATGKAAGY